jgi:hypothetical protein
VGLHHRHGERLARRSRGARDRLRFHQCPDHHSAQTGRRSTDDSLLASEPAVGVARLTTYPSGLMRSPR